MKTPDYPWLALADAVAWPTVAAAVIGFSLVGGPAGLVPLVLTAACPVWAAMRLRRALGRAAPACRPAMARLLQRVAMDVLLFLVALGGLACLASD